MRINLPVKAVGLVLSFVFLLNIFALPVSPASGAGVINEDGTINKEVFDRDWQKYSDFDTRIPLTSKSWEAQQYFKIRDQAKEVKAQIFVLKRDMEIDRLMRLELREYKKNLVQNIKVNLLKSFWRLAYVTYQTIKSAKGVGESYAGLFTSAEKIEILHNGLKVVQGVKPSAESDLGKNTEGVIKLLDESLTIAQDPKKTGEVLFSRMSDEILGTLPPADLTPEEIGILRTQHLQNRFIDDVLQNSYRENRERRIELAGLEKQMQELEQELAQWEEKEKQRVADMLLDEFKKNQQEGKPAGDQPGAGDSAVGEPGAAQAESGLVGNWSGSWVITKVHIGGQAGEAERSRVAGQVQPIRSRVEKDAQGQYVFIDLKNNTPSRANIKGNQISMYNETQGVFARYTGVISDDSRRISGTVEIGDAAGVMYSGNWEVVKN